MLDPKKQHDLEQGAAVATEFFPTLWRNMYLRLTEEGFTGDEAMKILRTYIFATHYTGGTFT